MSDMPETIWARRALSEHRFGTWEQRRYDHDPSTEYRRADLPRPQDAARIAELEAENERLRAALRPFEEEAAAWENYSGDERLVEAFPDYHGKLAVGDLRAARAALAAAPTSET